ncbi:MAG: DUF397 domain-containing protein [Streptosporangiaceae bacterium]|jgi:hypothetical protein
MNPKWRKSSYSGGQGNCIEVADDDSRVMVRDTKQAGQGPVLTVGSAAWRSFMAKVKADASLSSNAVLQERPFLAARERRPLFLVCWHTRVS